MQSQDGIEALKKSIRTQHEEAVYNNIEFMESMHAKSYSAIFSTLNTKSEIDQIFEWTHSNEMLQKKAQIINDNLPRMDQIYRKEVASVFLESLLILFWTFLHRFTI